MYVLSIDLHYTNLNISLKIEISIIKAEVKSNEIPHDIYMGSIILEMVNFVLNSLNSGPALNVINPIIMAVVFTIFVAIFGAIMKPSKGSDQYES